MENIQHDIPDRHVFGEALLRPESVKTIGSEVSAVVGSSLAAAREDHVHGFIIGSYGNRNKIVNGDYSCRSFGSGPFSISGYMADQVYLLNGTGSTNAVTFLATPGGLQGLKNYYLSWNRTAAGSTPSLIDHLIEDAHTLEGKTVTVSFWTNSLVTPLTVTVQQQFGTGGAPSTEVTNTFPIINSSTVLTRLSATMTLGSVSGKTFGTNGDSRIAIRISRNNTDPNGILNIWGLQIEEGSIATPLESFPEGLTQAICARYLIAKLPNSLFGQAYSTQDVAFWIPFSSMRAAPSFVFPVGPYTNMVHRFGFSLQTPTTLAIHQSTPTSASMLAHGLAAASVNIGELCQWQGSTIYLSARY